MGKKCTNAEMELRIVRIADLILEGLTRAEIVRFCTDADPETGSGWGISERQVDNYLSRAHAVIKEQAMKDVETMRAEHLARRRRLARLAELKGDYRTALAAADSEAKIVGLFIDKVEQRTTIVREEDVENWSEEQLNEFLGGE